MNRNSKQCKSLIIKYLFACLCLLGVVPIHAQYSLKSGVHNYLSYRADEVPIGPSGPWDNVTNPTLTPQFENVVWSSGGSAGRKYDDTLTTTKSVWSSKKLTFVTKTVTEDICPKNADKTIYLTRSSIGTTYASGVPRYFLGGLISPPLSYTTVNGTVDDFDSDYWRKQPLLPGETITGNATDIVTGENISVPNAVKYYFSPHAKAVFASSSGQVDIIWRSTIPDSATGDYIYYKEQFTVSSSTAGETRTIYWTEKSFNGPRVSIPTGKIFSVNPIYNDAIPETVVSEYEVPGISTSNSSSISPELRTLWYEKNNGVGELHAYNVTGRLMVEYLGVIQPDGTSEFLGVDVVTIEQSSTSITLEVDLGQEILPPGSSGYNSLLAQPTATTTGSGQNNFYAQTPGPDGELDYYAERENMTPDLVTFYWLKPQNIAYSEISSTDISDITINWPKYLCKYILNWPDESEMIPYLVEAGGSSLETNTGLRFEDGNIPSIVSQYPNLGLATIDGTSQALLVNLGNETQSKTLLKFNGTNGGVWYVPIITKSNATTVDAIAYVGERIDPPSSELTNAGYIHVSSNSTVAEKALLTSYSSSAYIDPFVEGVALAETGAIIPVNALPNDQSTLKVYWFEKLSAPSAEFNDLYTPSVVANYTLCYRNTTVVKETFETAVNGWTTASTDTSLSNLTSNSTGNWILGGFGSSDVSPVVSKNFTISEANTSGLEVSFRLYCLDSWDNEIFRLFINDTTVLQTAISENATYTAKITGATTINDVNYTWTILPEKKGYLNVGNITDQTFRVFVRAIPQQVAAVASLSNLKVGFGSTLDEASASESFGIDDFSIRLLTVLEIVLASHEGTGQLETALSSGSIYNQPDTTQAGYNPNEEHALFMSGIVYALRDDLNVTSGTSFTEQVTASTFSSNPQVLIEYINPDDGRPDMAAYQVIRENVYDQFDYAITAGTQVNILAPSPLALMPLPIDSNGVCANEEIDLGTFARDYPAAGDVDTYYQRFTFKDRKGYDWIYRGPHSDASPAMGMNWFYLMRSDFAVPGRTVVAGTVLPYLRPILTSNTTTTTYSGDPVSGTPLTITYRPTWPTDVATIRTGETLTLPKNDLPAVRGQTSARVLYQQSKANYGSANASVILHDPTRAKSVLLNDSSVGLSALPSSLLTSSRYGKTYFQRAQPHLQQRFYFDPTQGTVGALVLIGEFVDPIAGEDYILLNVLSDADKNALKMLVNEDDSDRTKWENAIDALSTSMETFKENPSKLGTYIVDATKSQNKGVDELCEVLYSDTAVDSYALTAQGPETGYVTLLFGDGEAFTPVGDPVSFQVIKVASTLYPGDLKTLLPENPLDEQSTLRHSADFASKPELYDFQWAYFVSTDGSYPALFEYGESKALGDSSDVSTQQWKVIRNPLDDISQNSKALSYGNNTLLLNDSTNLVINDEDYDEDMGSAGIILKGADFTLPVVLPEQICFSAKIGGHDGFVVYVNNVPALAYNLPRNASVIGNLAASIPQSYLFSGGLQKQFLIPTSYFQSGNNTVEVALYSSETAKPSSQHNVNFNLDYATKTQIVVADGSSWQIPSGNFTNTVVIGGDASSAFGSTALLFSDNFYTMRYKPKDSGDSSYSEWTNPVLVENWVKRALGGLNPFDQRHTDLYNFSVSTDVSVITQAGKRWEGDVALSLENIDDFGLIEIYETLLNRVKSQSIDAGIIDPSTNTALLDAAGYLCDLYMILGNEAYDDALNPTIRLDGTEASLAVNSARFSFEGVTPTLISETLALLRGRDDSSSTAVTIAPAYNRLYWNYTGGIRAGEAIYALNYNILEKAGGPYADGSIDASDAQYMFPQGHGDAYGHYLTALKGYYKLLTNPNFTWSPNAEAVTVAGQTIQVDYKDERKFAAAAASLAKCGVDTLDFTARENKDSEQTGWSTMRDDYTSSNNRTRYWGSDEWASRVYQGAYFNWISANAMLPAISDKSGIEKIDRTTVTELNDIVTSSAKVQAMSRGLQAHMNTIGIAKDGMTFDVSPAQVDLGKDNFEQIYERAIKACINAKNAFDQASLMDMLLRDQNNNLDDYNEAVSNQESAYEYDLITLYGTPYAGDIGVGKLYSQGYTGADMYHSNFIDLPSTLVDTTNSQTVEFREPINIDPFTDWSMESVYNRINIPVEYTSKTYTVDKFSLAAFADSSMGVRSQPGKIQAALLEAYESNVNLREATSTFIVKKNRLDRSFQRYQEILDAYNLEVKQAGKLNDKADTFMKAKSAYDTAIRLYELKGELMDELTKAQKEFFPLSMGMTSFDSTSVARGATMIAGQALAYAQKKLSLAAEATANYLESKAADLEAEAQDLLDNYNLSDSDKKQVIEFQHLYFDVLSTVYEINRRLSEIQKANENVARLYAEGEHILSERETFRQRAASNIHRYRTSDVVFRDLRSAELSQYKSLFNLAQIYVYTAAKAYDYETGLLGTSQGSEFMAGIIGTYSLGHFAGETPVSSSLGDTGLAGILSDLSDEWSVVKGRLGFNNPDKNGTVFSLRQELFRIPTDQASSDDNVLWKQVLNQHTMSNVLNDPDVATYCSRIAKSDGTAVPGIVIPFSTTIQPGLNFFGWPLAAGDHTYSQSTFATKIFSSGVIFKNYVGMDPYSVNTPGTTGPASSNTYALSATPYVYLIPAGVDMMRVPALGGQNSLRSWTVNDQALPLPKNIGAAQFSAGQLFTPNGTLNENLWITRQHQAFRAVDDPAYFYSTIPSEFTNSRLIGRSAWNTQWKIVIPAYSLLNNEQDGLNRFINSVSDIKLFLRTYSNSGN